VYLPLVQWVLDFCAQRKYFFISLLAHFSHQYSSPEVVYATFVAPYKSRRGLGEIENAMQNNKLNAGYLGTQALRIF
jgi:hypothetical protein